MNTNSKQSISVKINTIKARGLKEIVEMHRKTRDLMPMLSNMGIVKVGPPPFSRAIETVVWFLHGEKPMQKPA